METRPGVEGIGSTGRPTWPRLALFICLCFWGAGVQINEALASLGELSTAAVVCLAVVREREPSRRTVSAWWPLGAFLSWAILAPALALRLPTGTGLARALDWLAIPLATFAWRRVERPQRQSILKLWAGVLVLSCVIAGMQHFGWWPGSSAFSAFRWTRIPFDRVYEKVPGAPNLFMAGGLLFHRLKFAHVSSLGVLAALVVGLSWRGYRRFGAFAVAGLGFGAVVLFPYARAASAALALSCVVAFALSKLKARAFAALTATVLLAILALFATSPSLARRFLSAGTEGGSGERSKILATGVAAVRAHPWVGSGLGRFRPLYFAPAGTPAHILENAGKAHNQFLSFAAEIGVPGAVLFVALLVWLASRFNLETVAGRFGATCLSFFVLLSMVHDPLVQAPFSMALALSLGVGLSTSRKLGQEPDASA